MKTPLALSWSVAVILIFNQCPSIVFVVKHLSFCQYGRVRCYPTNVAELLSSAFHNMWIYFRSLNIVLSPRFPTWKNNSRNSISTNTLRVLLDKKLGNQVVPTSKSNSRNSISTNALPLLLDKPWVTKSHVLRIQVTEHLCDLDLKDEFRWSLLKMV